MRVLPRKVATPNPNPKPKPNRNPNPNPNPNANQLERELVGACERLETNSPADNEVAALQAECERMRLELAERQRRCARSPEYH